MSEVRDTDPEGRVHEPLQPLLSAVPTGPAARALVSGGRGAAGIGPGAAGAGTGGDQPVRMTAWVRGRVQAVGYRWFVRSEALAAGLVGSATNLMDGRVEVVVEGQEPACQALLAALDGPRAPGRPTGVSVRWAEARGNLRGFVER